MNLCREMLLQYSQAPFSVENVSAGKIVYCTFHSPITCSLYMGESYFGESWQLSTE